ncbi:TPA: hypothetical protein DEP58_00775 [Patescibacteria group bacterium]|nr:MAG: hypothetical protein UU98_C0024G0009 [Parcubacteria group bacterium GW2011_GWD2_42_14]HCC04823.1 hypothetical protein [Patescibacteria group bacterium]
MSEGNILIEGKEYVSSDRAAKLVGYTKDYVGQLARAGKIEAKRIGRSWYIAQDSINKHKLSVHYILTKPKKPGRRENESDEISNIYIENSSEANAKHDHVLQADNSVNENAIHNDDEFDLLPRLKEKKRDVLLHTDIRFEEVHEVPETKVFSDFDIHNNHVKSIPIRKPVKEIVRVPSNHLQQKQFKIHATRHIKPLVGGIVVDGIRKPDANRHVQSSLPKNVRREIVPNSHRLQRNFSPKHEFEQENKENSKVVPVIGAIVVFTIFVVVYMFISTS